MKPKFFLTAIILGLSLNAFAQQTQPTLEETMGWIKSKIGSYYTISCKWTDKNELFTNYVYVDSIIVNKCTLLIYIRATGNYWYYNEKGEKYKEGDHPERTLCWSVKLGELSLKFEKFHAYQAPQKFSDLYSGDEYSGIILTKIHPSYEGEKFYLGLNSEPDIQDRIINAFKYAIGLCGEKGEPF